MDQPLAPAEPVCVTGASGYIASHLIAQLLERGYRVRGTVRSLAKKDSYAHLAQLPHADARLELVEAELSDAGAYDAAVAGCEVVMHTASPYSMTVKDAQRDLVDPAVQGTRNVLEACRKAGSVKRVVLTSSMAAITDEPDSDHVLTEADWNTKSTLDRNPYYLSKALAEREAWKIVQEEGAPFSLVVINPFVVIGPSLSAALNPSNQIFHDILTGVYPGIMSVTWGMVDVRDVARAHVLAMETPSAQGRYICAHSVISMKEVVELLKQRGYGGWKLPKLDLACAIGDFSVKLMSYTQPKGIGSYLRTHVGRVVRYDNGKIQRDLGLQFRPIEASIAESIEDMKRWGHLKAKS
jgi:dihydroflavonol-4-reductase